MGIRVERPESLLYLLFVREAWGFAPLGSPALDPPPDPGRSRRPVGVSDDAALARWAADWACAMERFEPPVGAPRPPDAETLAALRDLSDSELVAWAAGRPARYWAAGVDDDAFRFWVELCTPARVTALERTPERRSLPALVAAWRSGVRVVLELPFDGYLAERIGPSTLLVSTFTRSLPDLYTRALQEALLG
jgi:hypothetical protein